MATFLRACAIESFLSEQVTSLVMRRYYVEPVEDQVDKAGMVPVNYILDMMASIPAQTTRQELSWQLTTVEKLDHLESADSSSAPIKVYSWPTVERIVKAMVDKLHYFQALSGDRMQSNLTEIANTAIDLWRALRRDSCRIVVNDEPSNDTDGQKWRFLNYKAVESHVVSDMTIPINPKQLPSKPFVLVPQITGFFGTDGDKSQLLCEGLALSHDSPAFVESRQEVEHIRQETRRVARGRRAGSSAMPSPVVDRRPNDWPPHSSGL